VKSEGDRRSIVYVVPEKMGGMMQIIANLLAYRRPDGFSYHAVLTHNSLHADTRFNGMLAADTQTTIEYTLPLENLHTVMRRLADALAAAEATPYHYSAICADALRLAIWTRKFSRQPGCGLPDPAASAGVVENPAGRNVRSLQKWRLKRVLQYVDDHLDAKITLQDLATVAGLSRMHFAAQFRTAIGMRPHEYLLKRRIERAEELLKQAEVSLVDVALTVGFQTQAHFTTVFKRFAGDTPHQWRSAYLGQSAPLPPARMSLS